MVMFKWIYCYTTAARSSSIIPKKIARDVNDAFWVLINVIICYNIFIRIIWQYNISFVYLYIIWS